MIRINGKEKGRLETASYTFNENAMMPKAEAKGLGDFVRKVTEKPKQLGGGWYEVRGKKVHGKQAAEEAMKAGD